MTISKLVFEIKKPIYRFCRYLKNLKTSITRFHFKSINLKLWIKIFTKILRTYKILPIESTYSDNPTRSLLIPLNGNFIISHESEYVVIIKALLIRLSKSYL